MKIAVVGSRNFEDYNLFQNVMDEFLQEYEDIEFVSGGASGADKLAEKYVKENNIPLKVYHPNWKRYKKYAGYKRNKEIWQEADIGIAFWDGKSKGTTHSFKISKELDKDIFIYNYVTEKFIDLEV